MAPEPGPPPSGASRDDDGGAGADSRGRGRGRGGWRGRGGRGRGGAGRGSSRGGRSHQGAPREQHHQQHYQQQNGTQDPTPASEASPSAGQDTGPETNNDTSTNDTGTIDTSNSSNSNGQQHVTIVSAAAPAPPLAAPTAAPANTTLAAAAAATANPPPGADVDEDVCFICANPIIYFSLSPCNHITCHICGLRMRALYKSKDCAHCRTPADFVIFTSDPNKSYDMYDSDDIADTDKNIGIRYTSNHIVGDTLLLLRYNCPDPDCPYAGLGWPNLHKHVRASHNKRMCDLCTRNKKCFTHEHDLFADKELHQHMTRGDDRPGTTDQTGFKGHPLCSFCGERFYDEDKLFLHCREKHERCFLCDRHDPRRPHYYRNWEELDAHFRNDHFPCEDRACVEKKFIVFDNEVDLKRHQLEEHASSLSKEARRETRTVDLSTLNYRQPYQEARRGGRGGRGGGVGGGGGAGASSDDPSPPGSTPSLRRDEIAYQRSLAIRSAQTVTSRTFGAQLSGSSSSNGGGGATAAATTTTSYSPGDPPAAAAATPSVATALFPAGTPATHQPTPDRGCFRLQMKNGTIPVSLLMLTSLPSDLRARMIRHTHVVERASALLGNDSRKVAAFRALISSYHEARLGGSKALDAFFILFADAPPNSVATLVREVADLYDGAGKGEALRSALNDWRAINEDYPSLPGLGGMVARATGSAGWASAVAASAADPGLPAPSAATSQRQTTRVLKLKNSTRRASASTASSLGSGPRVPPPPSAFPALPVPSASPLPTAPVMQPLLQLPSLSGPLPSSLSSSSSSPAPSETPAPRAATAAPRPRGPAWPGGGGGVPSDSGPASSRNGTNSQAPTPGAAMAAPPRSKGPSWTGGGATSAGSGPAGSRTGADFPALPTAPKPQSSFSIPGGSGRAVRRDLRWLGATESTPSAWGASGGGGSAPDTEVEEGDDSGSRGSSRGKGKKKQIVLQWG